MPLSPEERDPWWTLLVFFNSLRELGTSLSLLQSDIPDYLFAARNRSATEQMRRIWDPLELTGRLRDDEVPQALESLEISTVGTKRPIDVCLASSIVEVGVDVDRLSLICVFGQPKTTSQYIQVTGRVGRRWWERPGLVTTIYSPSKPRDRSHFEKFRSYHEKLYGQVEPTSVTPFSPPVIERALHAVMIGYARQFGPEGARPHEIQEGIFDAARTMIARRANVVDREESTNVLYAFDRRREQWKKWERVHWTRQGADGDVPLMRAAGQYATMREAHLSWAVPRSLRNVDAECRADITSLYNREEPSP
jgi:superfamily II DNA/RNA helicase